jgi:alkanesulfonate monooxygenase SsuD/methylene tetrahydromethanopterin reductase-like flavin-dependent oxidoreductase (luciferase family)
MKFGIYIANYALKADPRNFVKLAEAAEEAGWDGFFMWDHVYPIKAKPATDPWMTLAAIAAVTSKIRLGTTVTALPRRRPHKLAREVVSIDQISDGRFTLGVGLGGDGDLEFATFGEEPSIKVRAEKLEEFLLILEGLWTGEPFSFSGKHYHIDEVTFKPRCVQKPRVPIWCAGTWPKKAPFRRAARYEGVFPLGAKNAQDIADIHDYMEQHQPVKKDFDLVIMGTTEGDPKEDSWLAEYPDVGTTWYTEVIMDDDLEKHMKRVRKGPPVV